MLRSGRKGAGTLSEEIGARWRPYARLHGQGELVFRISESEYREFLRMREFALARAHKRAYNRIESAWVDRIGVSRSLLLRFRDEVEAAGARFAVVDVTVASAPTLLFL